MKKLLLPLATALTGCISIAAQADSAVWALRGTSNTVYLAGSVHALPANDSKLPATIDKAYADAEALVMEIDLDDLDEAEAAKFMMERGTLPPDKSLSALMGEASYTKLAAEMAKLGIPAAGLERLEPWAVALVVTQMALAKSGFDPNLGVDQQLAARAKQHGKPITGLESITDQLNVFDSQPYDEQVKFLELSNDEASDIGAELAQMIGAWRTANLDILAKDLDEEFKGAPKLYKSLLADRNAAWIPKILALREGRDDYLVVVGALHLVGPDSVVTLLERRGVKLERVR
jgi:uncharacterized protein YbaP (TraB family)